MIEVTLTLTNAEGKRLQDALTESLDLEAPATVEDLKGYIIADLKQIVRTSERRVAQQAIVDTELVIS